ncbi:dye decolorizing peroxidase [Paraoerskovia marina]|uniref:Dye decolorizing peroxidase n=1 Tax=Paraoerskovia marina TaxID=545619 RepID=A0A1H1RIK7_9CELL|nr:Dyp-type peroxidase [Paraoerskovia marina]SDS35483.1 dye decolorizing peroxidase [Paraoerskovia marina]
MSREGLNRRSFLTGGAAAIGGAALALGGRAVWDEEPVPMPAPDAVGQATEEFRGIRQAGVSTRPQAFASFVALDLRSDVDHDALVRLMRIWTDDIERLSQGRAPLADTEPELGAVPARLTVTVGYGPAVFRAAGLERLAPAWLRPLPAFTVDRLEDRWNDGDVVLQVCADDETTVAHAVRLLVKDARTFVTVRWLQRGFRSTPGSTPPGTTMRNLMGQVDGTRNPDLGVEPELVWQPDGASDALAGSTSLVVRRIAMNLDTWDELDRDGREKAVGRRLDTGAPLTGRKEHDVPDLDAVDANGLTVIAPFAHVRRARDDEHPEQRFLRRGYNYDEAPAPGELSSSGLIFATYQADVDTQFVPIQRRLDELDLLNEWTTPIGSAVFFVPGGARAGEYLGQRLLES